MNFQFLVTTSAERTEGKFASREEIAGALMDEISGANPGDIETDEGGAYSIDEFDVSEYVPPKPPKGTVILFGNPRQAYDVLYRLAGVEAEFTIKTASKVTTTIRGTIAGVAMRGENKGLKLLPADEPGVRVVPFNELVKATLDA